MAMRASVVQGLAKQKVGYSQSSTTGQHLRDEIVKRFVQTDQGPGVAVGIFGKDAQRALYHHQGTAPHIIRPSRKRVLSFYWPKAANTGRMRVLGSSYVFFKQVNHPGTHAVPFLRDALYEGFNSVGSLT
jgi:hypothetical protein